MDKVALLVKLQAKKGKEAEVADFLCKALPDVENKRATSTWYALRLNQSTYIIFDTFVPGIVTILQIMLIKDASGI